MLDEAEVIHVETVQAMLTIPSFDTTPWISPVQLRELNPPKSGAKSLRTGRLLDDNNKALVRMARETNTFSNSSIFG